MAISHYKTDDGETLWKVYVNIRSKTNAAIRAQRRIAGVMTLKEAQKEETKLIRECEREILEKENQGSTWSAVVDAWEQYIFSEKSSSLANTTQTDYVAAIRNYTSEWMQRPANGITKLNVREVLTQLRAKGGSYGFQRRMKRLIYQHMVCN